MWNINAVTGQLQSQFLGTLVSIGETKLSNSNGTVYRIAAVKLPNGKTVSARVYEKNFAHGMSEGAQYMCTATKYTDVSGNPAIDVTMSHLTGASRGSVEDFDFLGDEVAKPTTAIAATV
jgi:hypothetical protein